MDGNSETPAATASQAAPQVLDNVNLQALDKNQLIKMVISLSDTAAKIQQEYTKLINFMMYNLERNFNMSQQYLRRDSLEISGIPANIKEEDVENEVIEIFKEAKVILNRQPLKSLNIQAAHRIGRKGKVIVKVVN